MAMTEGYWVSPQGKLIAVDGKHIRTVLDHPDWFGYESKDELRAVYKKYHEPIGVEAKARQEIMLQCLERGWIRVRYVTAQGWTLEGFKAMVTRRQLREAVDALVDSGHAHYDEDLHIVLMGKNSSGEISVVTDEDYMFSKDSGEGGVLTFLDSSIRVAFRSALNALWRQPVTSSLSRALTPWYRFSDELTGLYLKESPEGAVFSRKKLDFSEHVVISKYLTAKFVVMGDGRPSHLTSFKTATDLSEASFVGDLTRMVAILNTRY